MKGLIISLFLFCLFVFIATLFCHFTRVNKRPLKIFIASFIACTPLYFAAYCVLPADLFFIPQGWLTKFEWIECAYGYVLFLLNAHSFVDFYFGFNGGLSMSIMLALLQNDSVGMRITELADGYVKADEKDKLIERRIENLLKMGLITKTQENGIYSTTAKGQLLGWLGGSAKRAMNLGKGG